MKNTILSLLVAVGLISSSSAATIFSQDFSNLTDLQIPSAWTLGENGYSANAVIEKDPTNENLTALTFSAPTLAAQLNLPAVDLRQYLNSGYNINLGFSIYYKGTELGKSGILIGGGFSDWVAWFVGDENPGGNPYFTYLNVSPVNSWNYYKFDVTQSVNVALALPNSDPSSFHIAFEDWSAYLTSPTTKPYIGVVTLTAEAIPEPSTYALLGLGASALFVAYRRKVA